VLSIEQFQQRQDDRFADNEFLRIVEKSFRDLSADMVDTFVPLAEANVPAYDPKRFYAEEYLVTFNDLYYRAKIQGFLPAPTPGQETAEWKPDLKPLPALLPYREITAQQGRDMGSAGLLVPSTLYRFNGRVDAGGDALDDVLVVAVSRHNVNGADAYAIGLDPQTREEYLLPVSYALATDTTAPRAAGAGGAVDAYTRDEADALLAAKGSEQVQAQHTLQLKTLGVQAAPVMAYLESGDVAGFATLDEALADTRPKTFMRFNVATVTLTKSNDPLSPNWASYVDGAGATLLIGAGAVLSIPGSNLGTLLFKNFFIFQAPGTRGGRVKLLASGNTSTPPGLLPLLDGQCSVPLEFSGGAVALRGAYGGLLGTGTAHLFEPYDAGSIAQGITPVEHKSGGTQLSPATTTSLGGLLVGAGLQVDGTGKVSLKIDTNTLGQRADGTLYVPTTSGNISAAATPTNVMAILSNGGYTCTINWDAKPGATLYQVYRSVNGGPWALIVGVPYNYFVDGSGVTANTYTLYRITAANSLGESAPSVAAQAL
jgi:hypothetical protein